METIKLEFLGLPSEYLRAVLSKYKQLPDNFEQEFERLMENQEKKFVDQDLKRERFIYKRREKRMEKLQRKIDEQKEKQA